MAYSIRTEVRKESHILPQSCISIEQGWAMQVGRGGGQGWLIRAHEPRSETISCKGQTLTEPCDFLLQMARSISPSRKDKATKHHMCVYIYIHTNTCSLTLILTLTEPSDFLLQMARSISPSRKDKATKAGPMTTVSEGVTEPRVTIGVAL